MNISTKTKKRVFTVALSLLIVVVLILRACTIGGEAQQGRIVDENGQPVEDALVLVTWVGNQAISLADSTYACIHLDVAKTDKDGRYSIPSWTYKRMNRIDFWISDVGELIHVYKKGYQLKSGRLVPFEGSKQDRLKYLLDLSRDAFCGTIDERKKSFSWHRALYLEANDLVKIDKEKELAMAIKYNAVKAWIGDSKTMSSREIEKIIRNIPELNEALK